MVKFTDWLKENIQPQLNQLDPHTIQVILQQLKQWEVKAESLYDGRTKQDRKVHDSFISGLQSAMQEIENLARGQI